MVHIGDRCSLNIRQYRDLVFVDWRYRMAEVFLCGQPRVIIVKRRSSNRHIQAIVQQEVFGLKEEGVQRNRQIYVGFLSRAAVADGPSQLEKICTGSTDLPWIMYSSVTATAQASCDAVLDVIVLNSNLLVFVWSH